MEVDGFLREFCLPISDELILGTLSPLTPFVHFKITPKVDFEHPKKLEEILYTPIFSTKKDPMKTWGGRVRCFHHPCHLPKVKSSPPQQSHRIRPRHAEGSNGGMGTPKAPAWRIIP